MHQRTNLLKVFPTKGIKTTIPIRTNAAWQPQPDAYVEAGKLAQYHSRKGESYHLYPPENRGIMR